MTTRLVLSSFPRPALCTSTHVWVLLRDELSFPSHPLNIPFVIQQPDFQVINQIMVLLCLRTFYGFPLDVAVNKTPLVRAYKTPPKQLLLLLRGFILCLFPLCLVCSATGPSFLSQPGPFSPCCFYICCSFCPEYSCLEDTFSSSRSQSKYHLLILSFSEPHK